MEKAPKPFPRRKSLKKRQEKKKRSLSEEKERSGVGASLSLLLKDTKKTSSSVDFLRVTSSNDSDDDVIDDVAVERNRDQAHLHIESNGGKETPSFRSTDESTTPSQTPQLPYYVTLTPEGGNDINGNASDDVTSESPYEETRSSTNRIVKDTLDLVLKKTNHFLRGNGERQKIVMDRTRADDWDILSHVPFCFQGIEGRRYEIFAASLKADPAKAYCLMVLPTTISFRKVCVCAVKSLLSTEMCCHHFPILSANIRPNPCSRIE